ncbi:MAG: cytochrome C biogenesis protein CcmF [Deltaproteobacteria bacterium HGW-Deltaproteobacteria-8]|nr:MAG: cytochrome C biogenesis protein CcmF [Deltaproteobacteria bacterium HGW-Deltaproteobacteria-8]
MHMTAYITMLFALIGTLFLGGWTAAALLTGRRERLVFSERGQLAITALLLFACGILLRALVLRDYSFYYVMSHVDSTLEMAYVLTAFWAGSEGSLLFWEAVMALSAVIFMFTPGYKSLSERTRTWFWIVFFVIQAFFLLMLTCWVNPFVQAIPAPLDGKGMNPLLRNPGMIFHPPLLLLGYAVYVIPACAALGAAFSGETPEWIKATRNWSILAWVFLTSGIILGGWWSYMELGWGGYWAWDPVENASLIPWCTGTAFVHTAIVGARRNALAKSNILIMALTFVLCVFGTYLVRSGVVESLHAFGEGGVAAPLLSFILFLTAISVAAAYLANTREQRSLGGLVSREGMLVVAAWTLLALGFVVGLGTMWPVISKLWSVKSVGLDAHFYNRVCLPLFVLLALLFSACPWLGWKEGVRDKRGLAAALAAFVLSAGAFAALGYQLPLALIGAAGAVSCMTTALLAIGLLPEMRTRQSIGASAIHLGLGLMVLGVAFSGPYQVGVERDVAVGQSFEVGGYTLTLKDVHEKSSKNMAQLIAELEVKKGGKVLGTIVPERRLYRGYEQPFAEVAVLPGLGDEIFSVLLGLNNDGGASLKVNVNPLVNWVWIGGIVISLAPLFILRRRKVRDKE